MLQTFTLKNGIRVATYNLPQLKSVYIQETIKGGSVLENRDNNGVAHFMEHILVEGIPSYPTSEELSEYIESLAGRFNARTGPIDISFYTLMPYNHLESALKISSEVFFEPLFTNESIEKERGAIMTEIKQRMDENWYKISEFFRETRFKNNHPLILDTGGSLGVVEKLSREQILNFWQEYFKTGNTYLLIVGNLSNQNLEKLVQTYFGKYQFNETPVIKMKNSDLSPRKIALRSDFDLRAVSVDLSFPSLNLDDDIKLRETQGLALTILGRLQSSRLYKTLRVQRGLVYGIQSGASSYPGLGYVYISSQVVPQNLDQVLNITAQELLRFIKDGPSPEELEFAKNYLSNQWLMAFDNPNSIAGWIQGELFWEDSIRLPEDYIKMIQNITGKDLQKLMEKYWDFSKLNLTIQGPVDDSKENLSKFTEIVKVLK